MDDLALHADTARDALVHGAELPWLASPAGGVQRRLLERIGGEVALATSIVRYAPGSRFETHVHGAGEEFVVLEGVFSDEAGDYPAWTYVRNPPGSRHAPHSATGCTIFVKLRQMAPDDAARVVMSVAPPAPVGVQRLHEGRAVQVFAQRLPPHARLELDADRGGEELFVMEGAARTEGADLARWSWWRRRAGAGRAVLSAGDRGAVLWLKRGHLDRREG